MIPLGYLAKRIARAESWFAGTPVEEVAAVCDCISPDFADYMELDRNNGYWMFDSVDAIRSVADDQSIDLAGCRFFYYEAFEHEWDQSSAAFRTFAPVDLFTTSVQSPPVRTLLGYDVVTYETACAPCHSPLTCNRLAAHLPVNRYGLLASCDEAKHLLETGAFESGEPGPHRIVAVYEV